MGHCDSPARFGRDGGFFRTGRRDAPVDSSGNPAGGGGERLAGSRTSFGGRTLLACLRIYKVFLSPFFGGACKYYPSCSNYASEAIGCHGARRGTVLALKRLGRCRPFTQGGYDPVPEIAELAEVAEVHEVNAARHSASNPEPLR